MRRLALSDRLDEVDHRWRWLWWGIALQAIGVAISVVIAVPAAAILGVVVFGAIALLVAALIALAEDGASFSGGRSGPRRRNDNDEES